MSFKRSDRVAEAIKREMSDLILRQVKDPRIHFATVTDVEVVDDLRFAKIYVSVMGTEEEKKETLEGLQSATGFLRSELGTRVRLRFTPEIRFVLDSTLDKAFRIEELLQGLKTPPSGTQNEDKGAKAPRRRKKGATEDAP